MDKLFREYQDQWTRYGEAAEKTGGDNVKVRGLPRTVPGGPELII